MLGCNNDPQLHQNNTVNEQQEKCPLSEQYLCEVLQTESATVFQPKFEVPPTSPLSEKTDAKAMSEDVKENGNLIEEEMEHEEQNVQESLTEEKEDKTVDATVIGMTKPMCQFYYNWEKPLKLLYTGSKEYHSTESFENFTKGCHWSPDGTCVLVPSEDFRIRIYELPREMYSGKVLQDAESTSLTATLTVKEGGLIYDTCWYPFMNSWDPATCCFLSTSRESPIHLWDAFTSELRATYRAYNQVDEVESGISIQFINSGREVWSGFKNTLRVFDTERPGRQINTINFKQDFPNVTGLVSCIRENPIMPGLVAFGTYSKSIGLYKSGPLCAFKTGSGVTQIEFSPCGTKLFSAVRRSGEFLCWDLRNPGVVLYSFQGRHSDTNQRIQFDLTLDGNQVVSGGTNGGITVWEVSPNAADEEEVSARYNVKLSRDCINGVSLHKQLPIIATSSGQRLCDDELQHRDNSIRLWWSF